jgi:hypothetical protein
MTVVVTGKKSWVLLKYRHIGAPFKNLFFCFRTGRRKCDWRLGKDCSEDISFVPGVREHCTRDSTRSDCGFTIVAAVTDHGRAILV